MAQPVCLSNLKLDVEFVVKKDSAHHETECTSVDAAIESSCAAQGVTPIIANDTPQSSTILPQEAKATVIQGNSNEIRNIWKSY